MAEPETRTLVTGASSGIGAAYARALCRRGERLVLVARRRDRLAGLARELGGEDQAIPWPLDLAEPGAPKALFDGFAQRGVAIGGLVNNAGLGHTAAFVDQPVERVRAMIDLNVRALVETTHLALPAMRAQGRGRIVNVASTAAFQPVPFLAVYAASKAFVLSFTEGLAEELRGSGVVVQALCPGVTATEFLDVARTEQGMLVRRVPAMTAEAVVAASLEALERGAVRVVAGWPNRVLAFAVQRLAPRGLARRVAAALYRPPPAGPRRDGLLI